MDGEYQVGESVYSDCCVLRANVELESSQEFRQPHFEASECSTLLSDSVLVFLEHWLAEVLCRVWCCRFVVSVVTVGRLRLLLFLAFLWFQIDPLFLSVAPNCRLRHSCVRPSRGFYYSIRTDEMIFVLMIDFPTEDEYLGRFDSPDSCFSLFSISCRALFSIFHSLLAFFTLRLMYTFRTTKTWFITNTRETIITVSSLATNSSRTSSSPASIPMKALSWN